MKLKTNSISKFRWNIDIILNVFLAKIWICKFFFHAVFAVEILQDNTYEFPKLFEFKSNHFNRSLSSVLEDVNIMNWCCHLFIQYQMVVVAMLNVIWLKMRGAVVTKMTDWLWFLGRQKSVMLIQLSFWDFCFVRKCHVCAVIFDIWHFYAHKHKNCPWKKSSD